MTNGRQTFRTPECSEKVTSLGLKSSDGIDALIVSVNCFILSVIASVLIVAACIALKKNMGNRA